MDSKPPLVLGGALMPLASSRWLMLPPLPLLILLILEPPDRQSTRWLLLLLGEEGWCWSSRALEPQAAAASS